MNARGAEGDAESLAGLLDGHVVVEDELEDFALTPRQLRETANKCSRALRSHEVLFDRFVFIAVAFDEPKRPKPTRTSMRRRRPANHGEEPRLERRARFESRFPVEDFHVHGLQYVRRVVAIAIAAG